MSLKSFLTTSVALIALCDVAAAQATFKIEPRTSPTVSEDAQPRPAVRGAREQGLRIQRATPEAVQPAPAQARVIDESALRFYAGQGDTARVAAEVRRLKTLHPQWQPPQNLFDAAASSVDEQPFWQLLADKRFDELREQIALTQSQKPSYVPSADLAAKLVQAEARKGIVDAGNAQDWHLVIDLASEAQDLLVCREIDLLWRVAEAYSGIGDANRAVEVYRYILTNCDNSRERLATLQKASVALPSQTIQELIAAGRRRGGSAGEYETVTLDLIRRGAGKAAGGDTSQMPSERDIKLLEASARRGQAEDASVLGWLAFSRKDYTAARDWFTLATKTPGNAKATEGLILAIRNGGALDQAEALAYQHRDLDPLIRKLFVEIVASDITGPTAKALTPERQARLEDFVSRDNSALGAQALGWSLYNAGRFEPARDWFEKSMTWTPSEVAAVGLVVAAQRSGDRAKSAAVIARYKEQYPAVASLARLQGNPHSQGSGRMIASAHGRGRGAGMPNGAMRDSIKLYEAGRYQEAAAILDQHQRGLSGGMQELRAWAHYNANDYRTAGKIFTDLKGKTPSKSVEHGEFLTEIQARGNPHRWWYN